jgi:D-xylose transport system substrate-binding protein
MQVRSLVMLGSLGLSILIGIVIARTGSTPPPGLASAHTLTIGLSLDTLKEARWQRDRDRFTSRCQELGAEVKTESANSDDVQQLRDVTALIADHVDALVIVAHDGAAMARAVDAAHAAHIPVIAYDRLITGTPVDLYLSFDNLRVGALQAQWLVDHAHGAGPLRIVRVYGAKTDHNALLFKQGQDQVLAPLIANGRVQVVHEDWAEDWKPENGKKIVDAAITSTDGHFDAVLASNDGTASGAIQALSEAGLAGRVLVTGQDADLSACQRIALGTQAMTIYKPLGSLAQGAAEAAVRLARGEPIIARTGVPNGAGDVPAVLFDVVAVDRNNLLSTVVADGFQSYDAVYADVPADQRPPRPRP